MIFTEDWRRGDQLAMGWGGDDGRSNIPIYHSRSTAWLGLGTVYSWPLRAGSMLLVVGWWWCRRRRLAGWHTSLPSPEASPPSSGDGGPQGTLGVMLCAREDGEKVAAASRTDTPPQSLH